MLLMSSFQVGAQVLTLDSVVAAVETRNPMLKNYQARANAMTAYAEGGKNLMAPEVGGGFWMLPYKKAEDPRDKGQYMLSVQQKFTNPAKLRANQGYLESKAGIEKASEKMILNELRAQAKTTYYQWVVLEKKKNALKENEEIMALALKIAELRYPYNQSKLGNIYKAQGRLEEVRNLSLINDSQIIQKRNTINRLMNRSNDFHFSIDTVHLPTFVSENIDTSSLAENRSDIKRIDKSIQSMKFNQILENTQSKPDFTISYNHMIARGTGMPSQFMLLGMISIPIAPWSSKMYKANAKGMSMEIQAMKNERQAIINEANEMTVNTSNEIQTIARQIENYEKRILPALKKNYQTLMNSYEENREELPMVIDAWETLNAAQMQYLDTVQKYYENIVSYEKILEK
jgi:outer membrane protein TolC